MRKYRLMSKKGEGTFSEVFKAQNVSSGRCFAIKCMKRQFTDMSQVRRGRLDTTASRPWDACPPRES